MPNKATSYSQTFSSEREREREREKGEPKLEKYAERKLLAGGGVRGMTDGRADGAGAAPVKMSFDRISFFPNTMRESVVHCEKCFYVVQVQVTHGNWQHCRTTTYMVTCVE